VTFYKVRQLGRKLSKLSLTEPVRGTLDVVLKQDSDNSPTCVYNEVVALRLAQRLGIPLALGVPSVGDGGIYFASLVVGGLSINLPDISNQKMAAVARRYPKEAAAILVFDVWTLNEDRERNLKANLTQSPLQLIAAIDHEQTLLGRLSDPEQSLKALEEMEIPSQHPMRDHVAHKWVQYWLDLVRHMDSEAIESAVVLGMSVGGVHDIMQKRLARVMIQRKEMLPQLVEQTLA
jgi:hypothetical protein